MTDRLPRLDYDQALHVRRTTSDYIADSLRAAILNGRFEDGEELNQVALAEHFSVSRVPVREAIRRLQAEGLVSAEAHRRAAVIGFSLERIQEIFEVRELLEDYLLGKAAPHLDEARLARLREICAEMDATGDHQEWLAKNREFHHHLNEPSDARTALALADQMSWRVERYLQQAGGVERTAEVGAEHRRILDALEDGDVDTARREIRAHIEHTASSVTAHLRQSSAEPSTEPSAESATL